MIPGLVFLNITLSIAFDFIVKPGYVVYIPPYWFYSIEFQDKENEVCMVKYTTGANFLANIKHIGLYNLQQQNIQEKLWKPFTNHDENSSEDPIYSTDISLNNSNIVLTPQQRFQDISGNETLAKEFLENLHP